MSVNEKMKKIADEIRERTGKTDSLTLDGMAEGVCEVYDSGKAVEWSAFWDGFQKNGTRGGHNRAFYNWTLDMFKPKYDIKPAGSCEWMFGYFNYGVSGECDIAKRLEDCGVIMDTSGITAFGEWMNYTNITRMPALSTVGAASLSLMFYNNQRLHTIDELILKEDGSQTFNANTFYAAYRLANIKITGAIGKSNFNLQWSKSLSRKSLLSVLEALKINDSGVTVTLPSKCIDNNTDTLETIQGDTELNTAYASAINKGYTITFA